MSLLTGARIIAVGLSVSTFVFLFLHDSFRSDNLFLLPDLFLCTVLVVAAAHPRPYAVPQRRDGGAADAAQPDTRHRVTTGRSAGPGARRRTTLVSRPIPARSLPPAGRQA